MKKILIWGTGNIAKQVLLNGIEGNVVGFLETNKHVEIYQGKRVYSIDELPKEYDFIIVANSFVDEIYQACQKRSIPLDRVIFLKGIRKRAGYLDLKGIKEILGEKNYSNYCSELDIIEDTFFQRDRKIYEELNTRESFKICERNLWPVIGDKYRMAGNTGNYFWQDLWAARLIIKEKPKKHLDIGSRLDGFIAHLLAADIDVTMIDVRKFPDEVNNLHTIVDDATTLRQIADESVESISALCSLEHFGLGRYGDPIDPEACFKCFNNIQKKMKDGGRLYISVPIGKERVEFNAHRVFFASTIIDSFSFLKLEEFACVADGAIEYGPDIHKYDADVHNGNYRYGLFSFVK